MPTLVVLRHGESTWNAENRFTGWTDVDLSQAGEAEARSAGKLLIAEEELRIDVVHTSVLTRAVRTANLALEEMGLTYLPVRASLAPQRAPLRGPAGRQQEGGDGDLRGRAGEALAPELRDTATTARARRSAPPDQRPPLPRRGTDGAPRQRVPGRRRAPCRSLLGGRARPRAPRGGHPLRRGAREQHPGLHDVSGAHLRGRHRRPRHPDWFPADNHARRQARLRGGALPRRPGRGRGSGGCRGGPGGAGLGVTATESSRPSG